MCHQYVNVSLYDISQCKIMKNKLAYFCLIYLPSIQNKNLFYCHLVRKRNFGQSILIVSGQRRIQGCCNIQDGALCDNSLLLPDASHYHKVLHLGCCNSPRSASGGVSQWLAGCVRGLNSEKCQTLKNGNPNIFGQKYFLVKSFAGKVYITRKIICKK